MEVTDDVLAIYAAGMATDDQKMAVRNYMVNHPEEMDTIAMAMDKYLDVVPRYNLEIKKSCSFNNNVQVKRPQGVERCKPKEKKSNVDSDFWLKLLNDLDVK